MHIRYMGAALLLLASAGPAAGEDFESGSLSGFTLSGDADWSVVSDAAHGGTLSARSGDIGDSQTSVLELTVETTAGDLGFWYKVSAESCTTYFWDGLKFYIDGVETGAWCGEADWTQATFTVDAGTHTFRWAYEKDGSVSGGSDAAWIDDVTIPGADGGAAFEGNAEVQSATWFSVALKTDGTVWTWGYNGASVYGPYLGNGNTDTSFATDDPAQVIQADGQPLSDVVQVSTRNDHSLAVKADGSVWAWGHDSEALGLCADESGADGKAHQVCDSSGTGYLTGVRAVSAGNGYSLALTDDGTVLGWGDNYYSQVANSDTTGNPVAFPVAVSTLPAFSGMVAVAAGGAESFAIDADGHVWSWGIGRAVLGRGDLSGDFGGKDPGQVLSSDLTTPLAGIEQVRVGYYGGFVVALAADGSVYGWGDSRGWDSGEGEGTNDNGMADYDHAHRITRADGSAIGGVSRLAAGYLETAALFDDGTAEVWADYGFADDQVRENQADTTSALVLDLLAIDCANTCNAVSPNGEILTWVVTGTADATLRGVDAEDGARLLPVTEADGSAFLLFTPPDADGDGVPDDRDAFPNDPTETADSDGDGVGDNADAFPSDATEAVDSDGDGVGDNGDAFPNDATEWADSDGDGIGDNADANDSGTDSDGDGVDDGSDAFPNDPTETTDSDGDGTGDNADPCPNDATDSCGSTALTDYSGYWEASLPMPLYDSLSITVMLHLTQDDAGAITGSVVESTASLITASSVTGTVSSEAVALTLTMAQGDDCQVTYTFDDGVLGESQSVAGTNCEGSDISQDVYGYARTVTFSSTTAPDGGDSDTDTDPAIADLEAGLTVSPTRVDAGDNVEFAITITNNGTADAEGVSFALHVPQGLGGSVTGCTIADDTLTCPVGTVAAGYAYTSSITIGAGNTASTLRGELTVTSTSDESDSTNNTASASATVSGTVEDVGSAAGGAGAAPWLPGALALVMLGGGIHRRRYGARRV